jgi:hypothetical protein
MNHFLVDKYNNNNNDNNNNYYYYYYYFCPLENDLFLNSSSGLIPVVLYIQLIMHIGLLAKAVR